jgi:hypothetical protein
MDLRRQRNITGSAFLAVILATGASHEAPVFVVAPTTLDNFSAVANDRVDTLAIPILTREAIARLGSCGFSVIHTDSTPVMPGEGPSYLFEHADVAAAWGAAHHADWEMQVVSVAERRLVNTRVVELKGFGLDSGLTAHLANRGAAWLMDQVTQSVVHASSPADSTVNPRPCRA